MLKKDLQEWLRILSIILLNQSEWWRQHFISDKSPNLQQTNSSLYQYTHIHFENLFFLLQHFLRSPESYATNFSYLIQVPLLAVKQTSLIADLDSVLTDLPGVENFSDINRAQNLFLNLNLNSSQSDPLIKIYFDFYLKFLASFSYEPKYRKHFLFIYSADNKNQESNCQTDKGSNIPQSPIWELIDSDGDTETLEQSLIDMSEDDLIKLYYQIPFNGIFSFLWSYLSFQKEIKEVSNRFYSCVFIMYGLKGNKLFIKIKNFYENE